MSYSLQTDVAPRKSTPGVLRASPKTHTPGPQLQQRGLRYYSPELGRWLSRDPAEEGGGENLYVFAANGGVNKGDGLGMVPMPLPPGRGTGWMPRSSPTGQCGKADLTMSVNAVLFNIENTFRNRWGKCERLNHCLALYGPGAGSAWDIYDLHQVGGGLWPWSALAQGSGGPFGWCERTVVYDGKCCHGGAVDYLMWGRINRLCHDEFVGIPVPPPLPVLRPWGLAMATALTVDYKLWSSLGPGGPYPASAALLIPEAVSFAAWGYNGTGVSLPSMTSSCSMSGTTSATQCPQGNIGVSP